MSAHHLLQASEEHSFGNRSTFNGFTRLRALFSHFFLFSSRGLWAFFSFVLVCSGFFAFACLGTKGALNSQVLQINMIASLLFATYFTVVAGAVELFDRNIRLNMSRSLRRILWALFFAIVFSVATLVIVFYLKIGRYALVSGVLGSFVFVFAAFSVVAYLCRRNSLLICFIGERSEISKEIKKQMRSDSFYHYMHFSDAQIESKDPRAFVQELKDFGILDIVVHSESLSSRFSHFALAALQSGIRIIDEHSYYADFFGRYPVSEMTAKEIISQNFQSPSPLQALIKRAVDFMLSFLLLLLTSPIMILVALAIKLSSNGSVLFSQKRQGIFSNEFSLLKFRSMEVCEVEDTYNLACLNDPRITKLGAFLRKTHLDELPQLWNIFKGEMSFVGPRPETTEICKRISEFQPAFEIRHMLRPGLTGLAQLNFGKTLYSESEINTKLSYDLYYVKNFSLILDTWLISRTAVEVFKGISW